MEQAKNVEVVFVNGLAVDPETGVILGLECEYDSFGYKENIPEPFRVTDLSSAEWVLELLQSEELEAAKLDARKEILLQNVSRMRKQVQNRIDWIRLRFQPELEAWAKKELEGKKTKTLSTVFGRIAFRKVPARLKVTDHQKALAWAEAAWPKAVKVERTFLVSELPQSGWEAAVEHGGGFEIIPEHESTRVDTGASGGSK